MPIIRVNGAALYYEEHGTGSETIVFAHGLLWSCRMFDAQVAQFKEHYRCVAFDLDQARPVRNARRPPRNWTVLVCRPADPLDKP
ncbi:MAG TPA: alpha/beta hydrolase [Ktedonobacteraceae bacterium]